MKCQSDPASMYSSMYMSVLRVDNSNDILGHLYLQLIHSQKGKNYYDINYRVPL